MQTMSHNAGNTSNASNGEQSYSFEFLVPSANPQDRPIIDTAEDAILAKQATVQAGYYVDPFVSAFCPTDHSASTHPCHRRRRQRPFQPLIKRGTHARVCCMDRAISSFLKLCSNNSIADGDNVAPKAQVVVLGAGKDTSYFRWKDGLIQSSLQLPTSGANSTTTSNNNNNNNNVQLDWFDVDHPSVIQEKAKMIQSSSVITQRFGTPKIINAGFLLESNTDDTPLSTYSMISHDLRLDPAQLLEKLGLNKTAPTLILLECVLMYMPLAATGQLLHQLSTNASDDVTLCSYEPILGNDAFGRMMEQNLIQAHVALPNSCLLQVRSLEEQLTRLVKHCGFVRSIGCNMWSAYQSIMTADQRKRANQCEFLDEVEEWMLIMRHYCFITACNSSKLDGENDSKVGPHMCQAGQNSAVGYSERMSEQFQQDES